jgi:hypothetical protein
MRVVFQSTGPLVVIVFGYIKTIILFMFLKVAPPQDGVPAPDKACVCFYYYYHYYYYYYYYYYHYYIIIIVLLFFFLVSVRYILSS